MADNKTIDYYNNNAKAFVEGTLFVDFESTQRRFTDKLLQGALILDFGCGSGRDTKFFLSQGFQVEAIDGSEELCKIAEEYTGIPVKHIYFQDLDKSNQYDGIWACSSILHLPKPELKTVMRKMVRAVKKDGIIYTSFKYGTTEGEKNGRYFTNLTEKSFASLIQDIDNIMTEELWVTNDIRPGREDEIWLNLILRKQ